MFLSLLTLSRCFTVSEASTDQYENVCLRFFFSFFFSDMMCRVTLLGRSTFKNKKKKRKERRKGYLRTSRQRGERNRVSFALYAGKQRERESSAGIEKILKKKNNETVNNKATQQKSVFLYIFVRQFKVVFFFVVHKYIYMCCFLLEQQ